MPPEMSPPTKFALCCSSSAGVNVWRAGVGAFACLPRDRLTQRPVTFENSRPVAIRLKLIPIRPGKPASRNCKKLPRRDVAKDQCIVNWEIIQRATLVFVTIFPPIEVKYDARAFAICCEPPRGIGQPTACPAIASIHPNAAEPGASSGSTEWAANPAKSA
jgi:hypothetical protein